MTYRFFYAFVIMTLKAWTEHLRTTVSACYCFLGYLVFSSLFIPGENRTKKLKKLFNLNHTHTENEHNTGNIQIFIFRKFFELNLVSTLFLIPWIHSTANNEKLVYNLLNALCSAEESFQIIHVKNVLFSVGSFCKYWIYVNEDKLNLNRTSEEASS